MIEKSETNSKRGPFFMFSGQKLRNRRQIPIEDLFFRDYQIFAMELIILGPDFLIFIYKK